MKLIYNKSKDCFFNLALEEVLLDNFKNFNEEIFMIWQNDNAIVIGNNQNYFAEINLDYAKSKKIKIVRRLSGGGAVYHDQGNINYTFITKSDPKKINNYQVFLDPIIKTLAKIGVKAIFSGKNDLITKDNYKISGNAQYLKSDLILHHGTLLFDLNIEIAKNALTPNQVKLAHKNIKSVDARIGNIKKLSNKKLNCTDFIKIMIDQFESFGYQKLELNQELIEKTKKLSASKYQTDKWNIKTDNLFDVKNEKYFENLGLLSLNYSVKNNKISKLKFFGDFNGLASPEELEAKLIGVEFEVSKVLKILEANKEKLEKIFLKILAPKDIIKVMFDINK